MKRVLLSFLLVCAVVSGARADEDSFAAWVRTVAGTEAWEIGRLETFVSEFSERIDSNPNDYNARILRSIASGLLLAENREVHDVLAKFGFALDFGNGFDVSGSMDSTSFWPKSNELADKTLTLCKPVLGQIIEDLSAIPESWLGMVFPRDKWPIDETIMIDYADVQYIKSMCYETLAALYLSCSYDINVDYEKWMDLFGSHDPVGGIEPRIPVLSSEPSLDSDAGWENSAAVPVEWNEFIDAFRVAFHGDKMYVRLVMKSGASLPENVAYEFYAELGADGMKGDFTMYFDPWDTHRYEDRPMWWWNRWNSVCDYTYGLSFHDNGKTIVFELPQKMSDCKDELYLSWIDIKIGTATVRVGSDVCGGERTYLDTEWIDEADLEGDFFPCLWHLYAEQTGIFRKVRNRNNLIYSREYTRLALEQMKKALAADEKRVGSNFRLIECAALEDYQFIRNRLYKYIDQAEISLQSVGTVDVDDFTYYRGINDTVAQEKRDKAIELVGNDGIVRFSFAPIFNGLSPREYMPANITLKPYFSSVDIALNTMKDPTFAGMFPDASDAVWYRIAAEAKDARKGKLVFSGTPREYVPSILIPVNSFFPSKLYGVESWYVPPSIPGSGTIPVGAASVYDGYLANEGKVAGTIQAKVAKPKLNKKTNKTEAKVTVTIQLVGEKKITVKGDIDASTGVFTGETKDGRGLSLTFGMNGVSGTFDGFEVVGNRNLFSSKDKSEKAEAEAVLEPWLGAMNMFLCGESRRDGVIAPYRGVLTVTVAKKGKVTVKGTVDGAKVSAKATALIGEDAICIPVAYSKKGVELAFTLWLPLDGSAIEIVGLDGAIVGKAGTLKTGAVFGIDGDIAADIPGAQLSATDEAGVSYSLLPDGVSVSANGRKWLVSDGAKAAKVKYDKKAGKITVSPGKKGGEISNASGLKLTYKVKDGSFKGSFYVYTLVDGKFKKQKATVTGVLIDGIGYGTAIVKKLGSWPLVIE